jgi:16S rRNA processing protein RimM
VGVILGAKGLRGEVRIKSFTENPRDVGAYGPVRLGEGRAVGLKVTGATKDAVIGRLEGIADRDAAEALKGVQLFVDRSALPATEGSYYHADLVGLALKLTTGETRGRVSAVFNFGAGDMLEVTRTDGDTELVPFSAAAIAAVDMAGGVVTANPLPGLFDDVDDDSDDDNTKGDTS